MAPDSLTSVEAITYLNLINLNEIPAVRTSSTASPGGSHTASVAADTPLSKPESDDTPSLISRCRTTLAREQNGADSPVLAVSERSTSVQSTLFGVSNFPTRHSHKVSPRFSPRIIPMHVEKTENLGMVLLFSVSRQAPNLSVDQGSSTVSQPLRL